MKKIASLIAMSVVAVSANAGTAIVSGNLSNWKSWNAASKAPKPYFVTAAGIDLIQANNFGDNTQTQPGALNIAVTGSATFDDVTGAITAMTLSQVGSWTGWQDTDGDFLADDKLTITGLQWSLDISRAFMSQTAGTFSDVASDYSSIFSFTESVGNTNDHGNGLGQSVFDFQGVAAGFKTLPRRNSAGTFYGTFSYKVWAATPGASVIGNLDVNAPLGSQAFSINVASMVDSGTITANTANTATFYLTTVPVPAAAWLMGSGLIGLVGIARRKKIMIR